MLATLSLVVRYMPLQEGGRPYIRNTLDLAIEGFRVLKWLFLDRLKSLRFSITHHSTVQYKKKSPNT